MKIYTITCHGAYNHGASLQAFALLRYLTQCSHDVEIIDYKPAYLSNHYKLFRINNPKWEKNLLTKLFYLGIKVPLRIPGLKRKRAFDQFTASYLTVTKSQYRSNEELKNKLPERDVYLCGSDQIWNGLYQNGKDPAFYLDFVPKGKTKASFAASFATEEIAADLIPFVQKRIKRLDGISVREKSGISILNRMGIYNGKQVVDPALLLTRRDWNEIGKKQFHDKYILVYDFDNNQLIKEIAVKISKEKNLKIYSINPGKVNYADKYFRYAGPDVFISLVRDAAFIISNSFHAAVFSVLYQKDFAIVNRRESINTRMRDFLEDLKLESRLVHPCYKMKDLLNPIDYKESELILNGKIAQSKLYLDIVLHSGEVREPLSENR
ncbi:polysaccharide pyruvyl transferase family protein [Oceanobacillus sojae]|uniref:polysaccharide pyruvyl transferase family protein n=1 Tax=Oceanobacillus sojae TaxID=582851 RepID=UPI0009883FE5|nr:polysaccharide pyruvyl transferase family protein [Oceanobacillus sojae]